MGWVHALYMLGMCVEYMQCTCWVYMLDIYPICIGAFDVYVGYICWVIVLYIGYMYYMCWINMLDTCWVTTLYTLGIRVGYLNYICWVYMLTTTTYMFISTVYVTEYQKNVIDLT